VRSKNQSHTTDLKYAQVKDHQNTHQRIVQAFSVIEMSPHTLLFYQKVKPSQLNPPRQKTT